MTLRFTHHGGRLAQACAHFGGAPGDWLDLSTGINPNPWTPPAALVVDWQRLPDPEALAALEAAAARHFGCDPALCAAVPGSETALRLIARLIALPGLCRPPCYGTYRAAFAVNESIADFRALPSRATALVVGNPNNPDGTVLPRTELLGLLAHQERHGGWLIADEAFADCDALTTVPSLTAPARRLIVLRSFGKFFGLAGLRLGFVIAPPSLLAGLRRLLGDWPVHAAALALGTAAYADHGWIARTRRDLGVIATQLDAMLARHGLRAQGACPLFRLIETPCAPALFERLARQHVLTRPFAERPDLLRLGLPATQARLERLERALG